MKGTIHIRHRTIRPSSRKESSNYRIKVDSATPNDLVLVFIDHESEDFREIFKLSGSDFMNSRESVSFQWDENEIKWIGQVNPVRIDIKRPKSIQI